MPEQTAVLDVLDAPNRIDPTEAVASEPELVDDELLVEDVSIDGMCGVY